MSLQTDSLFDFFQSLPIQIKISEAPLTSEAGLLPLHQFDESIGLTRQIAAILDDPRCPYLIEHSLLDMVRMRIFGILAGYEDQNDHDTLRTDPVIERSEVAAARSLSNGDPAPEVGLIVYHDPAISHPLHTVIRTYLCGQ